MRSSFHRNPDLPVNSALRIGKNRAFSFFLRLYDALFGYGYCLGAAGFKTDFPVVPQWFGLFDLPSPDLPCFSFLYADLSFIYFRGLCISVFAAFCCDVDRL